jgi:hypothetical protein
MTNKRFQLIKPYVSDKIYETDTMMKGAKKCYKELKDNIINQENITNVPDEFTIMDIESYKKYVFKINKNNTNSNATYNAAYNATYNATGGGINPQNISEKNSNNSTYAITKLQQLDQRVSNIENILNNKESDDNICDIM